MAQSSVTTLVSEVVGRRASHGDCNHWRLQDVLLGTGLVAYLVQGKAFLIQLGLQVCHGPVISLKIIGGLTGLQGSCRA